MAILASSCLLETVINVVLLLLLESLILFFADNDDSAEVLVLEGEERVWGETGIQPGEAWLVLFATTNCFLPDPMVCTAVSICCLLLLLPGAGLVPTYAVVVASVVLELLSLSFNGGLLEKMIVLLVVLWDVAGWVSFCSRDGDGGARWGLEEKWFSS